MYISYDKPMFCNFELVFIEDSLHYYRTRLLYLMKYSDENKTITAVRKHLEYYAILKFEKLS